MSTDDAGDETQSNEAAYYAQYERPDHDASFVICLDTNVYRKHGFSSSLLNKLKRLLNGLPNAKLLLPNVVLDECARLYKADAASMKRTKNSFVPDELKDDFFEQLRIAIAQAKAKFEAHWEVWRNRLMNLGDEHATTDALAGQALKRLMERRPPCKNGEEMRDAVIWEALLNETRKTSGHGVFVSDNTADFAFESDKDLQQEAAGESIYWFKTLHDMEKWFEPLLALGLVAAAPSLEPFEQRYAENPPDLSQDESVLEVIHEYLLSTDEYFDADPEIYDADRSDCAIVPKGKAPNGNRLYEVYEEWDVQVAYSVSADYRFGGGEWPVSGHSEASGHVKIWRSFEIGADDSVVRKTVDDTDIKLEQDEPWDPNEAIYESMRE